MERQVKERLVGAAVLIAAAVILIPELLSGPKRPSTAPAPARAGEAPMKTYTIDLNRSPDAPAAAAIEEQAPPQEASPSEIQPVPDAKLAQDKTTPDAGDSASVATHPPASIAAEPAPLKIDPPPPARPSAPQAAVGRSEPQPAAPQPETKPESAAVKSATPARPLAASTPVVAAADKKSPPKSAEPVPLLKPLASAARAPTSRQWAVQLGSFSSKANAERLVQEWEGRGQRGSVSPVQAASGTLYRARLGPFPDREEADATLRKVRASVNGAAIVALP